MTRERRFGTRVSVRTLGALLLVVVASLLVISVALAAGGLPSQSFTALPGKLYSGDTTHQAADSSGRHREFWKVALRANDYVTIDWSTPTGTNNRLSLYAHDLNDYNLSQLNAITSRGPDSTGHDEYKWVATSTGTYYLMFWNSYSPGGAYQFKVSIRRGVRAGDTPSVARLAKANVLYGGDISRHVPDASGTMREFWRLTLHSGQELTVQWSQPVGGQVRVYLDAPGTNNSNYGTTSYVSSSSTDSTGHAVMSIRVPRTGRYYLAFQGSSGGAYKFRVRLGR